MGRKQFLLRIDPDLWRQLEKWAADDLRSVNAQIEWLLREAVRTRRSSRTRQDRPSRRDADEREGEGDRAAGVEASRAARSISQR